MKRSRVLASILALAVTISVSATGCAPKASSSASDASAGKVSISLFNSKGEISTKLDAAAKTFNETNKDGITVTISSLSASSTVDETMMSKYASGNPFTLSMVDPINIKTYASKSMDLSNESWVKNINPKMVEALKDNGKIVAFPLTVEGDGLVYNKTTIEKATGKPFDPTTIKSLSDLEALYKKIQAGGVTPVQISHDDWSLAAHYIATAFETQNDYNSYFKSMKSGATDIGTNETYTGLVKLLDLNKTYNVYKSSPMSSDYSTTDPQNIATGKVAFWFNGNWVMTNVKQFLVGDHANDEFGFLPLFADSKTTDSITAGVTKVILIDKTKTTEAQRKAANEFLNWLVSDAAGQKALVTEMGIIPAFTNITIQPNDALSKSIMNYMKTGKTIPFINSAGDYSTKVGVYMQQYISNKMDKDTLTKSINSYFTSASWVN